MVGFPGTTEFDAYETIGFLLKNEKYIDTIDVSNFMYAKHTYVDNVSPLMASKNDWALDYKIRTSNDSDLDSDEARILSNGLESLIIKEKPKWTHPIYRMYSTWT